MVRSRHSVVVGITVSYVLVWAFGVACAFAAMTIVDRTDPTVDGDDALGFILIAALAFIAAVVVGHVVWIVRTAQVLRPYRRGGRTTATAALPPASLVLTSIAVNDLGVHWLVWPLVGVGVPAVLSWWATEPDRSIDHGGG